MEISKGKVLSAMIWRFLERVGAEGVTFIVSIILARLLQPEDYSTIAIVTVLIGFLMVFIDSGLGSALVQRKDADSLDFSTVFFTNLLLGAIGYIIMYICAPWIAAFYGKQELTSLVRVLSISLVVYGIKIVQQAYISKTLQFKKFFYATLSGTIGAAILGIWMAYAGYGVWALVAQNLLNLIVDTIILWFMVEWKPKFEFSFKRLFQLVQYGWKILVNSIFDSLYESIKQLLIGKNFELADLAYYNKGNSIPQTIILNINSAIESVLFPSFSAVQDDKTTLKIILKRGMQSCSFVIFPMCFGLAACADTVVRVLLTDKWLPCVTYLQLFCFIYATYPINLMFLDVIKGIGKSDMFLYLGIIKKFVFFTALLITLQIGPLEIAIGFTIATYVNTVVNIVAICRFINYSIGELFDDIWKNMALSFVMGGTVFILGNITMNIYIKLIVQIFVGIFVYLLLSCIFNNKITRYLFTIFSSKKKEE